MRYLRLLDEKKYRFLKDYVEKTPLTERKAIFLFLLSPDSFEWPISSYLRRLEYIQHDVGKFRHIAVLAQPDLPDLHIGRGKALLGLKRSQEADTFNTVFRRDPQSVKALKGQGRAYEQLAQQVFEDLNRQAEECYERAKQLEAEEM